MAIRKLFLASAVASATNALVLPFHNVHNHNAGTPSNQPPKPDVATEPTWPSVPDVPNTSTTSTTTTTSTGPAATKIADTIHSAIAPSGICTFTIHISQKCSSDLLPLSGDSVDEKILAVRIKEILDPKGKKIYEYLQPGTTPPDMLHDDDFSGFKNLGPEGQKFKLSGVDEDTLELKARDVNTGVVTFTYGGLGWTTWAPNALDHETKCEVEEEWSSTELQCGKTSSVRVPGGGMPVAARDGHAQADSRKRKLKCQFTCFADAAQPTPKVLGAPIAVKMSELIERTTTPVSKGKVNLDIPPQIVARQEDDTLSEPQRPSVPQNPPSDNGMRVEAVSKSKRQELTEEEIDAIINADTPPRDSQEGLLRPFATKRDELTEEEISQILDAETLPRESKEGLLRPIADKRDELTDEEINAIINSENPPPRLSEEGLLRPFAATLTKRRNLINLSDLGDSDRLSGNPPRAPVFSPPPAKRHHDDDITEPLKDNIVAELGIPVDADIEKRAKDPKPSRSGSNSPQPPPPPTVVDDASTEGSLTKRRVKHDEEEEDVVGDDLSTEGTPVFGPQGAFVDKRAAITKEEASAMIRKLGLAGKLSEKEAGVFLTALAGAY